MHANQGIQEGGREGEWEGGSEGVREGEGIMSDLFLFPVRARLHIGVEITCNTYMTSDLQALLECTPMCGTGTFQQSSPR